MDIKEVGLKILGKLVDKDEFGRVVGKKAGFTYLGLRHYICADGIDLNLYDRAIRALHQDELINVLRFDGHPETEIEIRDEGVAYYKSDIRYF